MSKSTDLAILRQLCASSVDLLTSMPLGAEVLRRLVPSFSLSLIRVDEHCAPWQHYSEHFDEASHQLFASVGPKLTNAGDDPAAFGNLLRNRRPYGTLIDNPSEYLSGSIYKHLFARNGIHHCLDVAFRDSGGPIGILGIFRERDAKPFTRDDVTIIASLYPLLVHGMRAGSNPNDDFDEVDTALVIVDRQGALRWSSCAARAWLEEACFRSDRQALIERHVLPEACRWLAARCRRLAQGKGESLDIPTTCLPFPGGRLRLRAYGLAPSLADDMPYVGVQLTLEMNRELRVLGALARSSLTPQQRRIAHGLWLGRKPAEIREAIGVSPATMKSYLKDLYLRLDVNSSAELLALLNRQAQGVVLDLARHRPRATT